MMHFKTREHQSTHKAQYHNANRVTPWQDLRFSLCFLPSRHWLQIGGVRVWSGDEKKMEQTKRSHCASVARHLSQFVPKEVTKTRPSNQQRFPVIPTFKVQREHAGLRDKTCLFRKSWHHGPLAGYWYRAFCVFLLLMSSSVKKAPSAEYC